MRFKYVLSEVATGLWRNVTMTIAMMITMAVSLTMLGASLLLYLHVNKMKDYYFARVEVSIFLKNEITPEQRDSLGEDLKSNPLVKSVQYVSKEEAYKQFQVQFKDAPDLVAATRSGASLNWTWNCLYASSLLTYCTLLTSGLLFRSSPRLSRCSGVISFFRKIETSTRAK